MVNFDLFAKKIPNNRYFVEIGFDFYEFNTLNLIKNGWNGKLIEIKRVLDFIESFIFVISKLQLLFGSRAIPVTSQIEFGSVSAD